MKEYILCAAIHYLDLEYNELFKDIPKDALLPVNCDRGIVFCGYRHPHCMYTMVVLTGKRQCEAGEEIQGFLTSKNRFVDRVEGAKIALESGQIKKLKYHSDRLFSEDLYEYDFIKNN